MGIRKYAFGYEMRDGKIQPAGAEAEVVRMLHERYAKGSSYRQLTELLNAGTVPYNEPDKSWTKNMVARILGNEIYIGQKGYPPILNEELLRKVQAMRPETGQVVDGRATLLRSMCRCASCGKKPSMNGNARGWQRWNCVECGPLTSKATLQTVDGAVGDIVAHLQANTALIRSNAAERKTQNRIMELEQALEEAMCKETFDDTNARAIALELAQARLEACGTEGYEEYSIKQFLSALGIDRLEELLPQIATAILIPVQGEIGILLKNGQIIERSVEACQ